MSLERKGGPKRGKHLASLLNGLDGQGTGEVSQLRGPRTQQTKATGNPLQSCPKGFGVGESNLRVASLRLLQLVWPTKEARVVARGSPKNLLRSLGGFRSQGFRSQNSLVKAKCCLAEHLCV